MLSIKWRGVKGIIKPMKSVIIFDSYVLALNCFSPIGKLLLLCRRLVAFNWVKSLGNFARRAVQFHNRPMVLIAHCKPCYPSY